MEDISLGENVNANSTDNSLTSPTFTIDVAHDHKYILRGIKNKIAFLDAPFVAGKTNRFMWYVWGEESEIVGKKFKIVAIKMETGEKSKALTVVDKDSNSEKIWGVNRLDPPLAGADATLLSGMSLPSKGLWCLNAYIGGELYGQIIVDVKGK